MRAGEGTAEEHHLRRIAELACAPGQDERFQAVLLDSLRELENWRRFTQAGKSPDSTTRRGMDEAELILRAYAHDTDSQEVRYRIDLVLAQFNGQQGIVGLLKFANYDAAARRLSYHYDFLVWEGTNVTTQIAFQNPRTRQTWLAPADFGPFAGQFRGRKTRTSPCRRTCRTVITGCFASSSRTACSSPPADISRRIYEWRD